MSNRKRAVLFAGALFALIAPPARANDTLAATSIGGLTLTKSEAIRMDSEDLFISQERVRVSYRFTNITGKDVESLVAFPLPVYVPDPMQIVLDFGNDLKFETRIDGEPVKLDFVQQALFRGRDVTARLAALKIPPVAQSHIMDAAFGALAKADLDRLVKDGLLQNIGAPDQPDWLTKWRVRTTVTRKQVFPAGKTVSVEHSYVPMVGGRVGGGLRPDFRRDKEFEKKRRTYCIDNDFLSSLDARTAGMKDPNAYGEVWLSYVLKTGANWAGPIRDFRLVVDKGAPESLVSFCGKGVNKISPTQFEVRYKDFVPKVDLDVLVVRFLD